MQCSFYKKPQKECNERCKYFETCMRSPYKQQKESVEDGGCKVDQNNNGCV